MAYTVKKAGFTALILLACIGLLSCSKPQEKPFIWEGTLLDFIMRDGTPYMGDVLLPCQSDDLIKAGIFPKGTKFPDDEWIAERSPFLVAPQKAYFSDIDAQAWLAYNCYEDKVGMCEIIFAQEDSDSRDQLFLSISNPA